MIFDAKESGVSGASTNTERVLLPRALDVVHDALELLRSPVAGRQLWFLVCDFSDAFWQVPIAAPERKFFCTKIQSDILVLMRAAQGSWLAPLLWARVAALVMRMTQAMLDGTVARVNCYVDDPIIAIYATESERDRIATLVITLWRSLGFKLAFRKAQLGQLVV